MSAATITADDLRRRLAAGEPVTVVDIRDAEDRAEWSIPGSIHVDAYEAMSRGDLGPIERADLPRDRPVVAVCYAGNTSRLAAQVWRSKGLDAASLEGGMGAWTLAWNTAEVDLGATRVLQVRRTGKGCLSYVLANGGEAAVVDAALPPDVYLALARERGWRIARVIDTHIHADHLTRGPALAEAAGATYHLPANDRATLPFTPMREGDVVRVGGANVRVLATPGHTPESACLLVDERALVTGDTLVLDAVGRPDLETDAAGAARRARALHASLVRLLALPPATLVLPAHVSEPVAFDGRPLARAVGDVRASLKVPLGTEDEFVAHVTRRLPPPPANAARIVAMNERGERAPADVTRLEAGANRCAAG